MASQTDLWLFGNPPQRRLNHISKELAIMSDEKKVVTFDLDGSLDDIDDLPGFVTPLSGAYNCTLTTGFEEKKIGEHPAVTTKVRIDNIMELVETPDIGMEAPKSGDMFDISFMLDHEVSLGKMKEFIKPLGNALGFTDPSMKGYYRQVFPAIKNMQVLIVMKRTFDKAKGKHYANVANIVPL
jgi:hypothetical protein